MYRQDAWSGERARELIAEQAQVPGALLVALHALQDEFGFIHDEAVPLLADAFNLSRAEIHGVVSFYHDFRRTAPGRHVLKVCRAEACQAMGADKVVAHIKSRLRVDFGDTTADGRFTLEAVYCLGNCACAPSAMLDGEPVGRLDVEKADEILAAARRP
jgi:formate dehydrogenase subunit gamma